MYNNDISLDYVGKIKSKYICYTLVHGRSHGHKLEWLKRNSNQFCCYNNIITVYKRFIIVFNI